MPTFDQTDVVYSLEIDRNPLRRFIFYGDHFALAQLQSSSLNFLEISCVFSASQMTMHKVYAAVNDDADEEVLATAEIDINAGIQLTEHKIVVKTVAVTSTRTTRRRLHRILQRLHRSVLKPYNQLSWTTKHAISVVICLLAMLYLLISVPFRIGFLYNPLGTAENGGDYWTWELSTFTPVDVIVDIIGVLEFVKFYRLWKNGVSYQDEVDSFEADIKLKRIAKSQSSHNVSTVRRGSVGLRQGKAKWTLANVGRTSSMYDKDIILQKQWFLGRNWELVLEIIALMPLEVLPIASDIFNALHLVRLTKLCHLYKLRRCFARISIIYSDVAWVQQLSSTGINSLVRTIGFCAASCHWAACGYMFIAHTQCGVSLQACDPKVETSWVIRDRLTGASVSRKYGRTLYWAARSIVLLGYDDVTPVSDTETIYAIGIQLAGALLSSSMLANFLFIFRFRNARYSAYSTHVDNAREYMRSMGIPRTIRHQVIAYYNYLWNTHHSLDSEEPLRLMPTHLQSKVNATLKASRIRQVCFLAKESDEFINSLALSLERRVYSPRDQIIEPKANAQMFFVIRGNVIISTSNGLNPNDCQTGDFFAEICLLHPEQYQGKAIAKTFCELYVLDKVKFDVVVAYFYRGTETTVVDQMAEALVKYYTQQRKTQKLLGHGGMERNSILTVNRRMSGYLAGSNIRVDWNLPNSSFRVFWDSLRLAAVAYVIFEVPYQAVFVSMMEGENVMEDVSPIGIRYYCTLLVEVFFGIDIVLRARYLTYQDSIVMLNVVNPALIFAAYKENGFYLDVFASLPIGLMLDPMPSGALRGYTWVLRLPRLLRARLLPGLLRDVSELHGISSKLRLFIYLLLGTSIMLHIIACGWFEMAWIPRDMQSHRSGNTSLEGITRAECLRSATYFENCSWVKYDCYGQIGSVFPAEDSGSAYKGSFAYVRSVYWSVVALTAVGYGDIAAYSTAESYFAALWIFLGGIINLGVLGAMSNTIASVMSTRHHHLEVLNILNSVMERMSISEKLGAKVRRFHQKSSKQRILSYESELLANLPEQLCYHISSLLHSTALKSVELFDSASIEFLQAITGKFRHRRYENGETICLAGDVCNEFLVLLEGSRVNVFFRSRRAPTYALYEGNYYGVYEFLAHHPHSATLTAASTVYASVMTREQFSSLERKFEESLLDVETEAKARWVEQQTLLRRIVQNMENPKLEPHVIQTSTLFYQRDGMAGNSVAKKDDGLHHTRAIFSNAWNAGVALWNVYNAIFVIFRIGYHSHIHVSSSVSVAVWITDLWGDLYFAVDMYLRLYYFGCSEAGIDNLVHRQYVDKDYRRSGLKWDLVASLPLYVPVASESLAVGLCRLPRLIRCLDLWIYMDDVIVQLEQYFTSLKVSPYLRPVKLIIVVVFAAHFVGSVFMLSSDHECESTKKCWIAQDTLIKKYDHALWMIYAKATYWAITTLLLTSSRDIVPRDFIGTIWATITCLTCTFAMGYVVGEITDLILGLDKEMRQHKNRVASFESFAITRKLSEPLRKRVVFFFRANFERTEGYEWADVIQYLSSSLRLKFLLEIYGYSIAKLPINNFLSSSQIKNLALRLQSELFIPGDNILVEGTIGNRLCILQKGIAAAFWTNSVASVAILMNGALFGEVAFFIPNQRRLVTIRATTTCEVLHVSKHDWEELWTPTEDPSDNQVQNYALHAILDWVNNRLQRYQRRIIYAASTTKRVLEARQERAKIFVKSSTEKLNSTLILPVILSGSSSRLLRTKPNTLFNSRNVTPEESLVSPELQVLDKKVKFLLDRTDKYVKRYSPVIATMKNTRDNFTKSHSSRRSFASNLSRGSRGVVSDTKSWRSVRGGVALASSPKGTNNPVDDILSHQFILDLNPLNKQMREILTVDQVRQLENECWWRFKLVAAIRHSVCDRLSTLIPPQNSGKASPDQRRNDDSKRSVCMDDSVVLSNRKTNAAALLVITKKYIYKNGKNVPHEATAAGTRFPVIETSAMLERRASTPVEQLCIEPAVKVAWNPKLHANTELEATTAKIRRSHSLPAFDRGFFENTHKEVMNEQLVGEKFANADIDFEVLQRSQYPQYEFQIHLYHKYRVWKNSHPPDKAGTVKFASTKISKALKARTRRKTLGINYNIVKLRRLSAEITMRVPNASNRQLARQRFHSTELIEKKTREFIQYLKFLGKVWDTLMVVIAVYYAVIIPFKVCFPHDLTQLQSSTLSAWAGFEIFLDVLCLLDIAYKVNGASQHSSSLVSSSSSGGISRAFAANLGLCADIAAILPLELLLLVYNVRLPLNYEPNEHSVWWATRWILRINRMIFVWRIDPLLEELLQYALYDCNLNISEPHFSFLRSFASYLVMGNFLACLWFATSNYGLHQYGVSWLVTSGMLTHMSAQISRHIDALSNFFQSVPLGRKYLRSLLFSIECLTTVYYGDIVSVNEVELIAEVTITIWCTYLYGTIVGAQGELLDATSRREATFELHLAELQLYLVQNNVPKTLKRQIKTYYAHMWHRSHGESDFALIEGVSPAIHGDVVMATLRNLAERVEIFRSLDEPFLRALLVCLQYVVCFEGEDIVVRGDVDRSMYFIDQGHVKVKIAAAEIPRKRGEYFGELSLLYGISRLETCVAMTVAELYRLDHEPYERLLIDFPEYRVRNKLAWTTASAALFNPIIRESTLNTITPGIQSLARQEHAVTKVEASRLETELSRSFVYLSSMKMLARLKSVNSLEARDLILKARCGACKHAKVHISLSAPQEKAPLQAIESIDTANEVYDYASVDNTQ